MVCIRGGGLGARGAGTGDSEYLISYSPAKKFCIHCQTPDTVNVSLWCQCHLAFTIGGVECLVGSVANSH